MKNEYSEKYPQRIYDHLSNPEFRELLLLEYIDSNTNYEHFKVEIKSLGEKVDKYSRLLFEVAKIEYNLNQKEK